jgi:hypothetical protein
MKEAVHTSETLVCFETAQCYIPEDIMAQIPVKKVKFYQNL